MAGRYKAGGFAVSAGSVSVTGLGFSPQGVIFFGSNRSEEDSLVTDVNAGIFVGMMAESSGGLLAQSDSVIPRNGGRNSGTQPIMMQSTFNVIEYAADPTSLDADGFTVNFTIALGGSRWIHYLAWGDWNSSDAARVTNANPTLSIGFAATSLFQVGGLSYGGVPGDWIRPDLDGWAIASWGGGRCELGNVDEAMFATADTPWYGQGWQQVSSGGNDVGWGMFAIGPFLGQSVWRAYATSPTEIFLATAANLTNSAVFAYWTGQAASGDFTPNAVAAGTVVEAVGNGIDAPEALIIMGNCGRNAGFSTSNPDNGMSFGIVTDDYQGCVVANMDGNYFYQSRTKAFASNAQLAGVNAGTVALNTDGTFTATTSVDSTTPTGQVYIALGPGVDDWIPHIYRWVRG